MAHLRRRREPRKDTGPNAVGGRHLLHPRPGSGSARHCRHRHKRPRQGVARSLRHRYSHGQTRAHSGEQAGAGDHCPRPSAPTEARNQIAPRGRQQHFPLRRRGAGTDPGGGTRGRPDNQLAQVSRGTAARSISFPRSAATRRPCWPWIGRPARKRCWRSIPKPTFRAFYTIQRPTSWKRPAPNTSTSIGFR